jgi:hypothetical protein
MLLKIFEETFKIFVGFTETAAFGWKSDCTVQETMAQKGAHLLLPDEGGVWLLSVTKIYSS